MAMVRNVWKEVRRDRGAASNKSFASDGDLLLSSTYY
jgi:hypothetical protein